MFEEHETQLIEALAEASQVLDSLEAGGADMSRAASAIKTVEVQLQHLALHVAASPDSLKVYQKRLSQLKHRAGLAANKQAESVELVEEPEDELDTTVVISVAAESIGTGVLSDLSRQREVISRSLGNMGTFQREVDRMTDLAKNIVYYSQRNRMVAAGVLVTISFTMAYVVAMAILPA